MDCMNLEQEHIIVELRYDLFVCLFVYIYILQQHRQEKKCTPLTTTHTTSTLYIRLTELSTPMVPTISREPRESFLVFQNILQDLNIELP
jgi:hypothetical protein